MRARWLAVGLLGVIGCTALPVPEADDAPPRVAATPEEPVEPADLLTLAAECMQRGDEPAAAAHLDAYVRAHPDQLMFRAHLAELLLRVDRPADAKAHFERFVAGAQAATGPPHDHLVHCHTRLMEIGQKTDDRFAELFHRGVGLVLLAADADDDTREEILCQALRALVEAKELRPTDPRVQLYLADAHDLAGNRRAADVARAAARNLGRPGALTPTESARLGLSAGR